MECLRNLLALKLGRSTYFQWKRKYQEHGLNGLKVRPLPGAVLKLTDQHLVDGVTKLTGITFQSRDDRQAENYRKMMVAMASDIRVILIKLADRLHNMRTIDAMPKNKQQEKARETLEIFAPLAHRLGIHAIKWELEDLAFATLHPRKFKEIKGLVNQQREERESYVARAGEYLAKELEAVGIDAGDQRAAPSTSTRSTRR